MQLTVNGPRGPARLVSKALSQQAGEFNQTWTLQTVSMLGNIQATDITISSVFENAELSWQEGISAFSTFRCWTKYLGAVVRSLFSNDSCFAHVCSSRQEE